MRVLDKKVFRDLTRLWAQALAIALVMACGAATLITSVGAYRSLEETRAAYYERYRFGDIFASLKRAPTSLREEIASIAGVAAIEARVSNLVLLDIEGMREPASGLALSLPDHREPSVNLPALQSGRLPEPGNPEEVAISEAFAAAHDFAVGSRFEAILNGTKRTLVVSGTALSPEFIYALGPGDLMPDPRRFGILFFSERALAGLFDLERAFNDVSLRLLRNANSREVIESLDRILKPYGGGGGYTRRDQTSHAFIDGELKQLQSMAMIIPPIFLAVSAFLINMILSRLIALEREQIGLFKAVGYSSGDIAFHYMKLVAAISGVGILIGFGVGTWLGRGLFRLFGEFYNFPFLIFRLHIDIYVIAAAVSLAAAIAGGVKAVWSTVTLPPAVAMQPPAPTVYHRLLPENFGVLRGFSRLSIMGFRHLVRHPIRSVLTTLGTAFAVGLLTTSMFFTDVNDFLVDWLFSQSERQDASIVFTADASPSALRAVEDLPGVIRVEPMRTLSARLRRGHRQRRLAIVGVSPGSELSRVVDKKGVAIVIAENGLTLSDRVAELLGARRGDMIEVTFREGKRRVALVPVSEIVPSFFGLNVFMNAAALDRLAGESPRIDGAHVTIDMTEIKALYDAVKQTPRIASVVLLDVGRQRFEETLAENTMIMTTIFIVLSVVIAFGVTYNAARIQLSERARELASLRVLGFTSNEVFGVLVAEMGVVVILAQPLGWLIGSGISWLVTKGFDSDLYRIPVILEPDTFAIASLIVIGASAVSGVIVWMRVSHLDLIRVLKTRD